MTLLAESRPNSACVCSVMLNWSETWPVKEDMMRLEINDASMVRWICSVERDGFMLWR